MHSLCGPPGRDVYRKRANKALNYSFTTSLTFRPVAATNKRFSCWMQQIPQRDEMEVSTLTARGGIENGAFYWEI